MTFPFDPLQTILGGLTTDQLQAALTSAQLAYLNMTTGAQIVTVSYGQGDGMQTVTYRQVNQGALVQHILLLKSMIDPTNFNQPRRARRMLF